MVNFRVHNYEKINKLDTKPVPEDKFNFKLAEIVKSAIDAKFCPYDGFFILNMANFDAFADFIQIKFHFLATNVFLKLKFFNL